MLEKLVWVIHKFNALEVVTADHFQEKNGNIIVTATSSASEEGISNDFLLDLNPLYYEASNIICGQFKSTGPIVDWKESKKRLDSKIAKLKDWQRPIIFYCEEDRANFYAAALGALVQAESIIFWTDVDGIYSADPHKVPDASLVKNLSYFEAIELSFFGNRLLHPISLLPAMKKKLPIYIRNKMTPKSMGTLIDAQSTSTRIVKGIAAIDSVSLINVEGAGMIGVSGIAGKIFSALDQANLSVVMISQASSEYSICFIVYDYDGARAVEVVTSAFVPELAAGHIQSVKLISDCSVLAIIGDKMHNHHGISASFFSALSRAQINIKATCQGSSERNISVVIDRSNLDRGIKAAHSAFYLSYQTLSVGIVGPGMIGSTLINQLQQQNAILKEEFNLDIRLRGIANSKKQILGENISLVNWREELIDGGGEPDLDLFIDHLKTEHIPHSVMIDCSASEVLAQKYHEWLEKGVHVITPNKKASSGDYNGYKKIINSARAGNAHFFYETTVGAGLPVISTLRDLIKTGDKIVKIEGVFSGTLSYIFNEFDGQRSFSQIVKEAKENGYTEPDPRDDLAGTDVLRKVIILARELGVDVELDDIATQNLVPQALRDVTISEYLDKLVDYDDEMDKLIAKAKKQQSVLRYVGSINVSGECSVSLSFFPKEHPFAGTRANENIISFQTRRYDKHPLIIRGPGAGAEVTAAGVFSDLLRLADLLRGN